MLQVQRLLIIEDDELLASALALALAPRCDQVCVARTLGLARDMLEPPPAVVLVDFALPDGTAEGLLVALNRLRPLPLVIAISGAATSEEAFRIARMGVRAYLPKPFDLDQLLLAWDSALQAPPDLDFWARCAVGTIPLRVIEDRVRSTMVDEAMAKTGGSRRGAARMLDVSRQLLQHMLKCA